MIGLLIVNTDALCYLDTHYIGIRLPVALARVGTSTYSEKYAQCLMGNTQSTCWIGGLVDSKCVCYCFPPQYVEATK
jgi:hypothetical protein